jgi:hypothetical protein
MSGILKDSFWRERERKNDPSPMSPEDAVEILNRYKVEGLAWDLGSHKVTAVGTGVNSWGNPESKVISIALAIENAKRLTAAKAAERIDPC